MFVNYIILDVRSNISPRLMDYFLLVLNFRDTNIHLNSSLVQSRSYRTKSVFKTVTLHSCEKTPFTFQMKLFEDVYHFSNDVHATFFKALQS